MGVSLSGLSRSIEQTAPGPALLIDPLNAEARVAGAVAALNSDPDGAPAEVARSIAFGLLAEPIDARFHSLLAELQLRQGRREEAYRLFDQALSLSRTELHALRQTMVRAVEAGDHGTAVAHLDLMLRRWPEHGAEIYPLLPALMAEEGGHSAIIAAMAEGAPWRSAAIRSLAEDEAGMAAAYRLLVDLVATERPANRAEIAMVVRAFLRAGRQDDAYRLFRHTMPEQEKALAGYVHNGGFSPVGESYPFSWTRRNTRGAEIRFSEDAASPGAIVRFLNAPAKRIDLAQTLVLPDGQYRLTIEADTAGLKAPRSLYWQVLCMDPRRVELARIVIAEGSAREQKYEAAFEVAGCAWQRLALRTDVIAESWQNRYSGQVQFRSVRIERTDLAQVER